jgi:protein-disulfide isomerase
LDTVAFDECVDSGRAEEIVQQDSDFARQLGVRSTPTFAVNGKPVQGALPYAQFQTLIEQELQNQ